MNNEQNIRMIVDKFLRNFKGQNKLQRGQTWQLGADPSFLQSVQIVASSIVPNIDNAYSLGAPSAKWADVETTKINNATPLAGTKVYYVSDTSGGATTRKLTFINGILVSET